MCWERIAYSRRRLRWMYARCSPHCARVRAATPTRSRLSAPVGTPSAWCANGLLSQRQVAIRARRGTGLSSDSPTIRRTECQTVEKGRFIGSFPPVPAEKVLFDHEGFIAMAHIATPTTLAQLVARSRQLGADRSVCNWGGGNTSAKSEEIDFRGRPARVLWVKGSGSDLATVTEASFTGLFLDDVLPLLERERMSDSEMVNYLAHCFSEPVRPRPSIETLLHGFLPFLHVDHTHADATNYFACAEGGEAQARDCFGDELIWIPYRRPGFGLAREVALAVRANPHAKLVILAKHGLITWGESDEDCYASTLATIARANSFVEARIANTDRAAFNGHRVSSLSIEERHTIAAQIAPV